MSMARKLLIKSNMRISLMNAPEEYAQSLGNLPPGVILEENAGPASLDLIILFARSLAELDALAPQATALVKYDGLLWIAYPKKSSKIKTDIDRDSGWERMRTIGLAGVAMVAMDQTWSAMRYRPAERVGK